MLKFLCNFFLVKILNDEKYRKKFKRNEKNEEIKQHVNMSKRKHATSMHMTFKIVNLLEIHLLV